MKMHVQGVQRYKIPIRLSYLGQLVSFREINRPNLWKWSSHLMGHLDCRPWQMKVYGDAILKMEQAICCLFLGKGVPTRYRDMEIGDIFYATVCANPSALKKKTPSNGEINEITPFLGEKSYIRLLFWLTLFHAPWGSCCFLLPLKSKAWTELGSDGCFSWMCEAGYSCDFLRNRNKNSEN